MEAFEVGQALRRRRLAAGMTQAEVARAMGSTQGSVSRAEAGGVMPSVRFLGRYAWATGRMLSMDIGPSAPVRPSGGRISQPPRRRQAAEAAVPLEDPVDRALAHEREARERLQRGEITVSQYLAEKVYAERDVLEVRNAKV